MNLELEDLGSNLISAPYYLCDLGQTLPNSASVCCNMRDLNGLPGPFQISI